MSHLELCVSIKTLILLTDLVPDPVILRTSVTSGYTRAVLSLSILVTVLPSSPDPTRKDLRVT